MVVTLFLMFFLFMFFKTFILPFLICFLFHSMYFNYLFHLDEVTNKDKEVQLYNCITQFDFTPIVKHTKKDVAASSLRFLSLPKVEKTHDNVGNLCNFFTFTTTRRCVIMSPICFLSFFFITMFLCS